MVLVLLGLMAALLVTRLRQRDFGPLLWCAGAVLAVFCFALAKSLDASSSFVAQALFNLYLLALGVLVFWGGVSRDDLIAANGGMSILALLFIGRFFDADLNLALRGVVFIVIGLGFLTANILFIRRRKSEGTAP